MIKYEVGKVVDKFKYHQEGMQFEIDDAGATMIAFFQRPTMGEVSQFASGSRFEIRFVELYGVIMITAKIGKLNWMDAPYTPHLSKNLSKFQIPDKGQGLGLTLILVDTMSGEVKSIRFLSLSEQFTRRLFGIVMEHKVKEFDKKAYSDAVNRIFSAYQTSQIVELSRDYCKING